MRAIILIAITFTMLFVAYLFAQAYSASETSKEWKDKYFSEQASKADIEKQKSALEEDKKTILQKALDLEKRTADLNDQITEMRKELQAKSKEFEKSKPTACPPLPPKIVLIPTPRPKPSKPAKKRIPYDIAPSQQ